MLTYPPDLLPQIVCPMDEDAIPPNPLCSAPPHSEPPLPLLSFSSITPSCANDGISGHSKSDRIEGIQTQTPKKQSYAVSRANKKPSRQNLSPTKRQRESEIMVSQSKQQKVENAHSFEEQSQVGLDFTFPNENEKTQNEEKSSWNELNAPAAEHADEHGADSTMQNCDASVSDMHTFGDLAVRHSFENASAPQGWLIGPLFQSFKSKMASFTEIVMSPAKLFTANSPPPSMDHVDKLTECEPKDDGTPDAEPSTLLQPVGQCEAENQEDDVNQQGLSDEDSSQNTNNGALYCSKKLEFDFDLPTHSTEQTDECAITWTEKISLDTVPLQDSPTPCIVSNQVSECVGSVMRSSELIEPPVSFSTWQETSLKISSPVEEQGDHGVQLKPLPRKCTGHRSEKQISEENSIQSSKTDSSNIDRTQPDIDNRQPDDENNLKNTERLWMISNESANGRSLKSTLDIQQLENQPNPDSYSAAGLGRSKRGMKICRSQDLVRRKKPRADNIDIDSGSCILMRPRPPRKEVILTNITVDREETLKPLRKRQTAKIVNKKGETKQKTLLKTNEGVLNMETESSPNPMIICSLQKTSTLSQKKQKDSNGKAKPCDLAKRPKTRSGFGQPDPNVDSIDLETTMAISSTRQTRQEPLVEVHEHTDKKLHQSSSSCRNMNKKPLKRKSPIQASSVTESDCTLNSVVPLELSPADFNASLPVRIEENLKTGLNPVSKRSKKGLRGAVKSSESPEVSGTCIDNVHLITKESRFNEGSKNAADSAYFEMTQFESNHQTAPPPSHLNVEVTQVIDEKVKSHVHVSADAEASDPSSDRDCSLKSSARRVNSKARRAVNQRRRCRVLHSKTHTGEEMTNSITMEDADVATGSSSSSGNFFSRRLLRSYSCPEILSLHLHDTPWTTSEHSPQHSRTQAAHQHLSFQSASVSHAHKFIRRTRRHTVCSVEVEREIAPLCLRKEVYPSRRSASYDSVIQHLSPTLTLSPSTSLSALASCFLSSPLAFLSKKVESREPAASPLASNQVSSPNSSSSLTSTLSSSPLHLPGFIQRSDTSQSTSDSSSSKNPLERETERRPQVEEEEDGEDTSLSSQEYEDVGLREEKALSDSEIKVVQKNEERGKVSSIRIRKTLPKPQNNLTPMGLPKPIRLKKKQFSLEEIYTNKNFSKPPESRLETIFEVPLSRRNGSESWFGQRRVKRFLEFLEVGEVRKPKKPLVGVGKAGFSSSRTRRGGYTKDEPSLSVQEVDSLLCAKLDQLNLWLTHDQTDS